MENIDFTKGILQSGPFLKVFLNENWCNINEAEYPDAWEQVQDWLAEHPEYVIADDAPPAPTPEALEASAEAQRQALFREYDTVIMMLTRAERLGDTTAAEKIAQWDAYAVQLQELNDAEGWYLNPVWPVKPIL